MVNKIFLFKKNELNISIMCKISKMCDNQRRNFGLKSGEPSRDTEGIERVRNWEGIPLRSQLRGLESVVNSPGGPRQSPGRKRFLEISKHVWTSLVAAICCSLMNCQKSWPQLGQHETGVSRDDACRLRYTVPRHMFAHIAVSTVCCVCNFSGFANSDQSCMNTIWCL